MSPAIGFDLGLQKAGRHLARGDGRLALGELDEIVRADRQASARPEWWDMRIRAVWSCGEAARALDGTARALAIWPHEPEFLQLRAELLAELGRLAEAEDIARWLLHEFPDHPQALATYAMILSRGGEHEHASDMLDRALRQAPDEPTLLGLKVALAAAAGAKAKELDRHLATLLAADPENPGALHMHSHRALSEGRFEEARDAAVSAARGRPGDREITDHARELRRLDRRSTWLIRQMHRRDWLGAWPWVTAFAIGTTAAGFLPIGGFAAVALLWAYGRFWPRILARRERT
ncbi:MAG: tetratricopeptide repeat protein [Thermoleophilia bacterium]